MWRVLVLVALAATSAWADEPRATPIGFEHWVHDRDVDVNALPPIACGHCHHEKAGRLVGRPDHAACFGACHGPVPQAPARGAKLALDPDRLNVCKACHAESLLVAPYTGRMPVTYPPYELKNFNIAIGHKQHAEIGCLTCHEPGGKKPTAPHVRCAGCHDGLATKGHGPAMAGCATCHPRATGKPQPPELAVVQNSVRSVFSHARHAARGGAGKDCLTCHAKVQGSDETVLELPRPVVGNCAGCHDGKTAFSTMIACTKCHDRAPEKFDVARPAARFSHAGSHARLVAGQRCTGCHLLDAKTGEVAIGGHALCTECHAADFAARFPKNCGACHAATEPWRHLRADRSPPDATEFGSSLDHGKHGGECTRCHALTTPTTQLGMPRGHAACSGTACHTAGKGPAPQLDACTGCHRLGLLADRIARRAREPWSVRRTFVHATHAKASDGSALACASCHVSLAAASVVELPAPKKATCAPCHDGTQAFKLTGTTCRRCHEAT